LWTIVVYSQALNKSCSYSLLWTIVVYSQALNKSCSYSLLWTIVVYSHKDTSTWKHTTLTTDIHAPGRIRTHNLSRRAAADLRLKRHGHWDRLSYWIHLNIDRRHYILLRSINFTNKLLSALRLRAKVTCLSRKCELWRNKRLPFGGRLWPRHQRVCTSTNELPLPCLSSEFSYYSGQPYVLTS